MLELFQSPHEDYPCSDEFDPNNLGTGEGFQSPHEDYPCSDLLQRDFYAGIGWVFPSPHEDYPCSDSAVCVADAAFAAGFSPLTRITPVQTVLAESWWPDGLVSVSSRGLPLFRPGIFQLPSKRGWRFSPLTRITPVQTM